MDKGCPLSDKLVKFTGHTIRFYFLHRQMTDRVTN